MAFEAELVLQGPDDGLDPLAEPVRERAGLLLVLASTELAAVRDSLVAEGERVLLALLTPVVQGAELEAAMRMLSGSVLQSALLHGQLPGDEVIAATVDTVLRGLLARACPFM